ncbi:heavy metal-associated isoprenylated plant protein 47-like [Argentina anserina]|uniref:heavy metal-associated isoprenylated plant protein 47-like n=1 Tax=Argentina anserina TaxID=57926 RepID=UPI00217684D6|nr:heavy metal-associated isoprenylated plant protein 47-like [Potentilla anserina]
MWNLCCCLSDSSVHCSASTVKQKIVMKVQFSSEKRRTEAFKIAAGFKGVSIASVEADKDEVVVIGVGIDSVCLAKSLRKKLGCAQIYSVEEVKKPDEEKTPEVEPIPIQRTPSCVQYPVHGDVVYWHGDRIY